MFTVSERNQIRDSLVRAASDDERITAAALVGSSAFDLTDRWSDIDLALRLRSDLAPEPVARVWTERMYEDHEAIHYVDVWSGPALYRVFLLPNTLQVDISFWPSTAYAARGEKFELLFGDVVEAPGSPPPPGESLIGMGWLYALHVRSSLARGRTWQALYMLNNLRDQIIALQSLRYGLPVNEGRGVDDLPAEETDRLIGTLPPSLEAADLRRAFASATHLLSKEASHIDAELASRIRSPLEVMVRSSANRDHPQVGESS